MDLRFTPEENRFRDEVRTFFRTEIPESIRRKIEVDPAHPEAIRTVRGVGYALRG